MSAIHIPHFWMLLAALAAVFVFRETVAYRRILRLKYILTPTITMLIILLVVLSMYVHEVNYYRTMIFSALLLGLVGDTLLMIEEINLLEHGMLFFLAGHCMYIAVFVTCYYPSPWHVALALALIAGQAAFYSFIRKRTGKRNLPVLFYMLVITVMLFFALSGVRSGMSQRAALIAGGAVLFTMSDTILSINQFIHPINRSTVFTWLLYAPAQLLFALSCFYV